MRIAFFGTPDFAVASLKNIVEHGYEVVGVFTAPDKPSGRGQQLTISEVKRYAIAQNLSVYQPEKLKNSDFVAFYQSLQIDIAVVVAYRMMPEVIWSAPRIGTFNLHGSLLPQYRGAAPINWAIINGETQTGVTSFFINSEIDKGDILFLKTCEIEPQDNFGTLYDKLKVLGAELVIYTLQRIQEGNYVTEKQNFLPTDKPAPKIDKDILEIKDYSSCIKIHNLIRGLSPVYKPYFIHKNKKYIIKSGVYILGSTSETIGNILTDEKSYLRLVCADGYYNILEIQAEGKKAMDIRSFLNGNVL